MNEDRKATNVGEALTTEGLAWAPVPSLATASDLLSARS